MRSIEITTSQDVVHDLVSRLEAIPGVCSIAVFQGVSVQPPGDVLVVQCTNDAAPGVTGLADSMAGSGVSSYVVSRPTSFVTSNVADQQRTASESDAAPHADIDGELRLNGNLDVSFHALMAIAGGIATVGIWTSQIHLVIGAMVVAPGFDPALRIPFGLGTRDRATARRGAIMLASGYAALAVTAAAVAAALQRVTGRDASRLLDNELVAYWSTLTAAGFLVSALAACAGAIGITVLRRVVVPGVMIALALVPAASLVGVAVVVGSADLAGDALLRWLVDVVLVLVAGTVVIVLERLRPSRRRSAASSPA